MMVREGRLRCLEVSQQIEEAKNDYAALDYRSERSSSSLHQMV